MPKIQTKHKIVGVRFGQLSHIMRRLKSGDAEHTFDESGVGRNVTLPISLSSRASIPGFSVYNFTLTTGNGCVVVKSP